MTTTEPQFRHDAHRANAYNKARGALAAARYIVTCNLAGDEPVWSCERDGLDWIHRMLFGDDAVQELAEIVWQLIGIIDAANRGLNDPIVYDTSRHFLPELLAGAIGEIDNPTDPFAGLGF